ncbi:hypothetical protein OG474_34665 [Kribbella sp. NBC_01505]|uniref:hypothetical protein n=1 Tax=Kribbella sp. NBC_01505 TaxID=2903580 RepID=UPI00386C7227
MGIFSRKQPPISTEGLLLDQTWDDPPLDAAYAAVRHGDLSTGLMLLKSSPHSTDLRSIRMTGLANAAIGQSEALELRLEALPGDPDLLCWLAQTLVFEAWEVRSAYRATHVSQQQFTTFHDILRTANRVVTDAIDGSPDDVTPWIALQWIALGLQFSLDDKWLVFRNALARQPDSYLAHARHVQTIAPKWTRRPVEELLQFGRDAAFASQPGRALGPGILALVFAEAIAEIAGDQANRDARLKELIVGRSSILTDAITRWWNPGHLPEAADQEAHQAVAFTLRAFSHAEHALQHANLTRGRISHNPWWISGNDPLTGFATARANRMRI